MDGEITQLVEEIVHVPWDFHDVIRVELLVMHSNLASSQITKYCLNNSRGGVDQKSNKIGTELS
jgi:hypothetical protein